MATSTSNSTILGAAAEHYVICQLLRRGMIAALAPAGVPDADIIVSNRLGSALAAVQVKARRDIGADGGWHMKAKHDDMRRDLLFYCFVDLGKELTEPAKCWVVPSAIVGEAVAVSYKTWLEAPGKGGKARKANDMRRLLPDYTHLGLSQYARGWLDTLSGCMGERRGGLGRRWKLQLQTDPIPSRGSAGNFINKHDKVWISFRR